MPNVARQMGNFPSPSQSWGRNLSEQGMKGLPGIKQIGQVKAYLETQTPVGSVVASTSEPKGITNRAPKVELNKKAKYIILDTDTLNAFFEKLADIAVEMPTITKPSVKLESKPAKSIPGTQQFLAVPKSGGVQMQSINSPVPRLNK